MNSLKRQKKTITAAISNTLTTKTELLHQVMSQIFAKSTILKSEIRLCFLIDHIEWIRHVTRDY